MKWRGSAPAYCRFGLWPIEGNDQSIENLPFHSFQYNNENSFSIWPMLAAVAIDLQCCENARRDSELIFRMNVYSKTNFSIFKWLIAEVLLISSCRKRFLPKPLLRHWLHLDVKTFNMLQLKTNGLHYGEYNTKIIKRLCRLETEHGIIWSPEPNDIEGSGMLETDACQHNEFITCTL